MAGTREVAESMYRAFLAGDKDGMLALMSEDVEVRFLGQVQLRGKEEASRFFDFAGGLLRDVDFTLEEIVVHGDTAAGIWHETATTTGGRLWENHGVDVIHVRRGQVVALHENNDVRKVHEHFPPYEPGFDNSGR
ncbi:MAG: nuclear transport factor 2 family protein [Nocardioides sp.]|nr:nuclear transport factor 2 family protein [Nocardioides sp.]MDI6908198.1 nuclear transport factor 2 family protein [Nocardioides sp.]